VEDINAWNKKTDNLFVWDYVTNFSHYVQPFPNLRSLKPNIRFFIDHGVKGLFEQGNYNGSGGGEMAELRNYLLARFLWDPTREVDTEMNEFLQAFYGPAAGPIRDYIDFAHDRAAAGQHHIGLGYPPIGAYFQGDFLERASALFDAAEEAARDKPEFLARVRKARMPILYVAMSNAQYTYRVVGDTYRVERTTENQAAMEEFFRLAEEFNVDLVSEWRSTADARAQLMAPVPGVPVETLRNADLRIDFAPSMGGRIVNIHTAASAGNWVCDGGRSPEPQVGIEEQLVVQGTGDAELEFACAVDGHTATLTAVTDDGVSVTRQIALPDSGAEIALLTTVKNVSGEPRHVALRVRPEFSFESRSPLELRMKRRWLGWRTLPMAGAKGEEAFSASRLPAGAWALVQGECERAAVWTFAPRRVKRARATWETDRQSVEMTTKTFELAPAKELRFTQGFRFLTGNRAVGCI
jgi:hypothetical protein